jgi:hypothetical protein
MNDESISQDRTHFSTTVEHLLVVIVIDNLLLDHDYEREHEHELAG